MSGTEIFGGFGRDEPIERIELGHDILVAQRLSAVLDEQSINHEVVLSDDPYTGLHPASTPHLLLVRRTDYDAVRDIVRDIFDDVSQVTGRSSIPPRWRFATAVAFVLLFAGPAAVGIIAWLIGLI